MQSEPPWGVVGATSPTGTRPTSWRRPCPPSPSLGDVNSLSDVITGCGLQQGEQAGNISRWASIGAGFPEDLPGTTIDRQCGSGQQAVHFAAQAIRSGEYDFAIGAGVESMSRVDLGPLFNPDAGLGPWYGDKALARYNGDIYAQGPSAELVVEKWGFTRQQLDEFSAESHRRAYAATEAGWFADALVPLDGRGGPMLRDEGIREHVDMEKMASLRPAFGPDGVLTGGNSSQISDGAAAVLVAERSAAEAAGHRPRALIKAMAVAADDPKLQFTAILPAARKALAQAGLTIDDIDRIEVNEAFSPVPLMFAREFGIGTDKINVNGGSIAIGHPIGSTGARMITQLVNELERSQSRYGLLTICEGGGMANATIIERIA